MPQMPRLSLIIGALLFVLGLATYALSASRSFTALLPSVLGLALVVCGLLGLRESLLRNAMHGAAVVSLLAILGTVPRLFSLAGAAPLAVFAQVATVILSLVFLVAAVRWFVLNRLERRRNPA